MLKPKQRPSDVNPSGATKPNVTPGPKNFKHLGNGQTPPGLDDHDYKNLRDSGLLDSTVGANGIYTETDPTRLATLLNRRPDRPGQEIPTFCWGGGMVFPYRDLDGNATGFVRVRPRTPRRRKGKDGKDRDIKYEMALGSECQAYYAVESLAGLRAGLSDVFLPEGEKKCLALAQLGYTTVSIGGIFCGVRKTPAGYELIPGLAAIDWRGRKVYIVFDYDDTPKKRWLSLLAAGRLADALRRAGAREVYLVCLPPGPDGKKNGVDDFLKAKGPGRKWAFDRLVAQARPVPPEQVPIYLSADEYRVNDAAVRALARHPEVFQRGGALVQVVRQDQDSADGPIRRAAGTPVIAALPAALVRDRLTVVARFLKCDGRRKENKNRGKGKTEDEGKTEDKTKGGEGDKAQGKPKWDRTHPPDWCVKAVHARGHWPGVRHLAGVVDVPVLKPDGTLLDQPGYDPSTGLLYLACGVPAHVPARPTRADARAAVKILLALVQEFPWKSEAHQAAWLAYLLTLLSRYAFDGPAPLTLFDANTPGTGKGLLCHVAVWIVTGRRAPTRCYQPDAEEMRKVITSAALAGDALVVLDNVDGCLGDCALEKILTDTRHQDRVLGVNKNIDLPVYMTWAATGNNVIVGGDMTRRTMHVRLDSPLERPDEREDFTHPDLLAHVREQRGELLSAALTILRAYCVAGRPDQHLKPWGSYEQWSALVRAAVVWAGLPDPALTREELRTTASPELTALPALLAGIERLDPCGKGLTVGRIVAALREARDTDGDDVLKTAFEALCVLCPGERDEPLAGPDSIGRRFRKLHGRIFAGRAIERAGADHRAVLWRVTSCQTTAEGRLGRLGRSPNPSAANCKKENVISSSGVQDPPQPPQPPLNNSLVVGTEGAAGVPPPKPLKPLKPAGPETLTGLAAKLAGKGGLS
jgi:hypothetical protein